TFGSSPSATVAEATWRRIADVTTPRSEVASAVFRGVVYVVGGFGGGNVVETYVPDRWSAGPRYPISVDHAMAAGVDTAGAPGPTRRDQLAAASIGGRVCAVGGRRLSILQNLAVFECYDQTTDSWQAMPDAPTARGGIGAATIGSRLFVTGGEQPIGTFK